MKPKRNESKRKDKNKSINIIQFLNIADNSLHPKCAVSVDEPIFQPEPRQILFEDYEPLQILTKVLKLRNRDKVPRRVSIIHPENRLFQVLPYITSKSSKSNHDEGESANTKVAPGMEVSYLIKFTPEAKNDISYDLVVITEREKFIVPIRGIGCKVNIEYTDYIDFGEVPVKYKIEKPFIIRNVGEKITKWMLKCLSNSVTISKKEGILDIGKNEQIICTFCPEKEKNYKEKMILTYDEADHIINIFGKSKNDAVDISPKILEMEPAYITLHTEKTVTITNDTGVPIEFVWKQFESKEKEEEAKQKVFQNLSKQEQEEKILNELQHTYEENPYEDDTSIDLEDSYDEDEIIRMNERNHLKNQNIIARRFEKIKKSLNEDQMCFEHPNFIIETLTGKVWPNTKSTITVTFRPDEARDYKEIFAYLDVTGSEKRIKLELRGRGIGPKARVNNPEFNLYDVPITHEISLEPKLIIYNIGVIPCEFTIEMPGTPCGKQFIFEKVSGVIPPRDEKSTGEQIIPIKFKAERLGEFSEKFNIKIGKSKDSIPIVFKGHVIAPYCRFNVERIDFEKVSMGFDKKQSVTLFNESDVDIEYRLRIATDSQDNDKAMETVFEINPKEGRVERKKKQDIDITFRPDKERPYDIVVLLDMLGIGFDMLTLPVSGICEVPEVEITPMELLDFGNVYLKQEVTLPIKLHNTSSLLSTQFKINKQDDQSKGYGELTCDQQSGQIAPEQTVILNVKLVPKKLNQLRLKLEIDCKTKGYNPREKDNNYITSITVIAMSKGPDVIFLKEGMTIPSYKDTKAIKEIQSQENYVDFGTVPTLKEKPMTISLKNISPIEATYTAFMKTPGSIFYVKEPKGKIKSDEKKEVIIYCKPDEQQKFIETLYFKIEDSDGFEVTLRASGEGTTIVPTQDMKVIDFGIIFTLQDAKKTITFENRGRSDQIISFVSKKPKKKPQDEKKEQQQKKKNDTEDELEVFKFLKGCPKRSLPSRKKGEMVLFANSPKPGEIKAIYGVHCYKATDNNGPEIWEVEFRAVFIDPHLEFNPPKLFYSYKNDEDGDKDTIYKPLTIKNASLLEADFTIKTEEPFSIKENTFKIAKNESVQIKVYFDPSSNKKKKRIETFEGKLIFKHNNHEKVEELKMTVQINFPNIKNLPNELYFGCLLNDTFTKKTIKLERDTSSDLDVIYEWELIELENSYESLKRGKTVTRKIPLNEVFSIVPMNGRLKKGELESEEVTITFTPGPNQRYTAIARCLVEGGPEYDLKLIGEASEIKYKIQVNEDIYDSNKKEFSIKYGEVPFNTSSKVEMFIKNEGEVPFDYRITYKTDKLRYLSLTNAIDSVNKGESKKILIEVIPGVPDKLDDEIIVEIAHFEPHRIKIKAVGYYSGIVLSTPLIRDEENYQKLFEETKTEYANRRKALDDYFPKSRQNIKRSVMTVTNPNELNNSDVTNNTLYEFDVNRNLLCEKIIDKMSKGEIAANLNTQQTSIYVPGKQQTKNLNVGSAAYRESQLAGYMKDLVIAEYHVSFGNIVATHKGAVSFKVINVNKGQISLYIDKKELSSKGYSVVNGTNNDKCYIEEGKSLTITVYHMTNNINANIDVNHTMKIQLDSGEVYLIHLHSFIAIPNLSLNTQLLDMGRVYLGRKKIMKFRIENISRVDCYWSVSCKDMQGKKDKEEKREEKAAFDIFPKDGKLAPGKKLTLTTTFVPLRKKKYQARFVFAITDNTKNIEAIVKGNSEVLDLIITPNEFKIGPILPYFKYGFAQIEIKNPNDSKIEVYSTDFDKKFKEEENILRYYRNFIKNPDDKLDIKIREAGEPIWGKFQGFNTKLNEKIEKFKEYTDEYLKSVNEQFENLFTPSHQEKIALLVEAMEDEINVKIPPAIDKKDRLNIILIGPEKSGKTSIIRQQMPKQYRGVVSLKNLLQWNLDNGHPDFTERIEKYKEEKKKEFDELKVAHDKLAKQAKTNKKLVVPDPPSENMYNFISKELFFELLQNRLNEQDCGIGVVFDDLNTDLLDSPETIIEYLEDFFVDENLYLAYFDFPKDKEGLDVCHYIDWVNYIEELSPEYIRAQKKLARKKTSKQPVVAAKKPVESPKKEDENANTQNLQETKKTDKKVDKRGDKKAKDQKAVKEVQKPAINPEVVKKFNEMFETFSKENAPLNSVANSSPKELTPEEKAEYESFVQRMKNKFNELYDRRINPPKEEPQEEEEKEDDKDKKKEDKDKKKDDKKKEEKKDEKKKDDKKKEEKKDEKKDAKKEDGNPESPPEEEGAQEPQPVVELPKFEMERKVVPIMFENCIPQLLQSYLKVIPDPKLHDPEELPIPPDEEYQTIKRPNIRPKHEMLENFTLKSVNEKYKDLPFEELLEKIKENDKKKEEYMKKKEAENVDPKGKKKPAAKKDPKAPAGEEDFVPEEILEDNARWVIEPNATEKAIVCFFCKDVSQKAQDFLFEVMTYPPVEYKIKVTGQSEYPSMTTITSRPKQGTINLKGLNKKYEEDFGYILITNDPNRELEKYKTTNRKTLRFTNNGKYDLKVDFTFLSSMNFDGLGFKLPYIPGQSTDPNFEANQDPKAKGGKPPKKGEPTGDQKTPFLLPKSSIEIKIGQTAELDVYAFPTKQTEYKDELICLIEDNPIPTRVLLTCKGAEPKVDLESDNIEFEKLVINQSRTKYLKMKNVSEVNCKWALTGLETLPPVFKIEPVNGIIEKGKEISIAVTFCSEKQDKFQFQFNLDIEDNLGYGVKLDPKPIKLNAEAFEVSVELVIDNEGKIIDFGNVKVKEPKSFPFMLKNLGIYKITYKFEIMKKLWQELFRFEPTEGVIEPGKEANIYAIFNRYNKDINISPQRNSSEIKLSIFEGEKGSKNKDLNIFVNVASYFSKYSINPPKSINFGSLQYNESATRSIEIRNEGQFDFNYEIFEYLQDINKMKAIKEEKDKKEIEEQKRKEQELKELSEGGGGKGKKQDKKPKVDDKDKKKPGKGGGNDDVLTIGKYQIKNFKGVIAPGSSAKIDVVFNAEGQQFCSANLAIDIQGRQPEDNPLGIPFDLVAESCIPGIETQDFDSIFEEQTVLPSISPDINRQNVITSGIYGVVEKVFWFGTIIASKNPNGVSERFKLINNNKIPCTVTINVKPRTNSKSEGFAFSTSSNAPIKIYPGESQYVTVTFTPTNVMPYSGLFEAVVDGGSDQKTGALRFELRGEGTLPTLLLESPNDYDNDGNPILKFKRTRLNKSAMGQIVLKNEGVVPATVKFEPLVHDCFSFESSTTATIQPKKYQAFDVKFNPHHEKTEKAVIQYQTMFNPYEKPKLNVIGEGYFEPVSVEGLINEVELKFGDVCVNVEKVINITLINNSENHFRFNFVNNLEPILVFYPTFGFLLAHTQKEIQIKFCSKETVKFILKDLFIELKQFSFKEGVSETDWDESMKTLKKVTASQQAAILEKRKEDLAKRKDEHEALINQLTNVKGGKPPAKPKDVKKDAKGGKPGDKNVVPEESKEEADIDMEETNPEPEINIVDKSEKYLPVKVTAISDYAKYECKIKEIRFKPTVMFGTRKFDFQLRNSSMTALNYKFSFTNPNPVLPGYNTNNLLTSYDKSLTPQDNAGGAFSISPQQGTIPAQSDEIITLRFSPLEIDEFNFKRILNCNIKDLDPSLKPLQIELSGDAERPLCHFEIQSGIKRENGATILEFESVGMMIKNTVRFFALNPTNQGYEFEWEQPDEDLIPNINKVFKCLTPKGIIYSGKKFEMVFEYIPNSLGNHEAFWNFKIINENQIHKFICHGITREPMILFNVGKVNFGPLLLGGRQKETIQIINEEHLPYKFSFDKESIKGNVSYGDSLFVTPITGTLQPKSSTKVEITFMPRVEKEFNYNLSLRIKQRLKPLTLNVKGVGYTIVHGVYLDNKPEMKLLKNKEYQIDFGEFFINDKRERSIRIENNGGFNFHFAFKKNGADYLKISPDNGTVTKGNKTIVTLTLLPLNKINLSNHKISLNIISGPTYTFLLNAKARSPQIIFSSIKCNFGPCYVMRQPVPNTQIITVKNMDKEALTIESDYKNKQYLEVFLSTGQVILPYQTQSDILEIPIQFIPRDYVKYKDIIKFKFNNIYDVDVEVTGEGIPLKVELEDPSLQTLNFNIIKLGQTKKLSFNIINRGKMMATVELYPESPGTFIKRCLSIKTDFVNDHPEEATKPLIHVLQPKEIFKTEVTFNPNIRIPQFTEDLMMKVNNSEKKRLLSVTGASYGVDVKMIGEAPSFGNVTVNSNAVKTITLKNFGDIPAVFNWALVDGKKRNYTKFFTITPQKASIPPHEEVVCEIIFHPKEVNNLIQFEHIKCHIEEFDTPVDISLYGKSIACPADSIFEKKIETQVRVPVTYEIKIKNPTDKKWRITPSISSSVQSYVSYFKGSDQVFEIGPGVEGTYTITYKPLTMSKIHPDDPNEKSKEHDATVFFPIPDGSAKIYKVLGTALPPSAQQTIDATATVREWTTIKLTITNWLYQTQRFHVSWGKTEQGIFIKGANTIDVSSNSSKEYKLSFKSLKETPYNFKITFENVDNKEYIFYLINVTMTPAKSFKEIELVGQVRDIVTGSFTINNPLNTDVTIPQEQIIIENEYLTISPDVISIPAESEVTIDVSFRPLIVGKISTNVTIKSSDLGELKYPISIEGTPAPPQTLQPIQASLGSDKIIQVTFTHFIKKPATYTIKVEQYSEGVPFSDFVPEVSNITVDLSKGGQAENSFNLRYEPSNVVESKGLLKATSPDGGEYQWIITGKPSFPQAQGPFKVPPGKSYNLEFKNPLNEAVEVNVRFDNPNFSAGKVNNKIEAKKVMNVPIAYKQISNEFGNTGRCIITINKLPPWVYYLSAE